MRKTNSFACYDGSKGKQYGGVQAANLRLEWEAKKYVFESTRIRKLGSVPAYLCIYTVSNMSRLGTTTSIWNISLLKVILGFILFFKEPHFNTILIYVLN